MCVAESLPKPRRYLSADALVEILRNRFKLVPDPRRQSSITYSMSDTLMSAFAMFSLKDPSLLAFQEREDDEAIRTLFKIPRVPSDSQMREILDGGEVEQLNESFADIFYEVQRNGALKRFRFVDGNYLVAIDGTGYFCSSKVRCEHCLEHKRRGGETHFVHQAVAAVLVHPDCREVIPLAIEPIVKQDGETKNDCERNASKRLLARLRKLHPKLKMKVVEDGLASNAPHIADLKELGFSFILGAKPGDHEHLFDQVVAALDEDRALKLFNYDLKNPKVLMSETVYIEDLELNASNPDVRVNFLQHFVFDPKTKEVSFQFSWVTEDKIGRDRLLLYQAGGRCRWKIENEAFNTLKNQGYNFEHNYGHGSKNLSTVLLLLMFLAFLVDQVQQACCPVFQAVLKKLGSRRSVWDHMRSHFRHFLFRSFNDLWLAILTDSARNRPPPPRRH
jgi:hypothetical protein